MAIPLAVASARKQLCQRCRYACHRPGWKWYHCTFGVEAVNDEKAAPEAGDDWWQGEDSICGAGLWGKRILISDSRVQVKLRHGTVDIGPVDTEAYRAELKATGEEKRREGLRRQLPRLIAVLKRRATEGERNVALIVLTEYGAVPHWLAQEATREILGERAANLGPA